MKRRSLRALAVIPLMTAGLMASGAAHATMRAAEADPADRGAVVQIAQHQDYLTADAAQQRAPAMQDQCGLPVDQRTGNWLCFDVPAANSARPAAAASTGFCNSSGCYTRVDDFTSYFSGNSGTWGYGSTVLGRETHNIDYKLQGAQTTSKPVQYINSVSTKSVVFSGDLLSANVGEAGSAIPGKYSPYNAGNVPGGTPKYWDPNGYKSYDTSRTCHVQVHQFSWKYGNYAGYWYSYVKSIVACKDSSGLYRFKSVSSLPASPYGGGYRT